MAVAEGDASRGRMGRSWRFAVYVVGASLLPDEPVNWLSSDESNARTDRLKELG